MALITLSRPRNTERRTRSILKATNENTREVVQFFSISFVPKGEPIYKVGPVVGYGCVASDTDGVVTHLFESGNLSEAQTDYFRRSGLLAD